MPSNAPLKKLMVIINPAAGVDRLIPGLLNAANGKQIEAMTVKVRVLPQSVRVVVPCKEAK